MSPLRAAIGVGASTNSYAVSEARVPTGALEALLAQKVTTLRELVEAVVAEGEARRLLSARLAQALAQEASAVQAELWLLPDGVLTPRRATLEARLALFADAHRGEQVACWRDLQAVAREARSWRKEYLDLQQRVALVRSPHAA